MRLTEQSVSRLIYDLDAIRRNAPKHNSEEILKSTHNALETLGFRQSGETNTRDTFDNQVAELVFLRYERRRPFVYWTDAQGGSRDWFVNAEVKSARARILKCLPELQLKLLDIAEAAGKVYDK